jgi:hypothetical protein
MLLPFTDALVRTTPFDRECAMLADRHYSRRTVGSPQFAYSGRKIVLRDTAGSILFVWIWPQLALRMDGQAGYNCAIFRNESPRLSSEIILEAERHALDTWGPNRMFTYIDPRKIRSSNPGCCFLKAGWQRGGVTKSGKVLLVKEAQCPIT